MDHHKKVQTSEAFINSAFLAVSGGFQDAYTYFTRDGVFSNAQTGVGGIIEPTEKKLDFTQCH